LGDGRAVDVDERPARPGATRVNEPRDEPLAGARLALEKDRRHTRAARPVECGQVPDLLAKRDDRRGPAEDRLRGMRRHHRFWATSGSEGHKWPRSDLPSVEIDRSSWSYKLASPLPFEPTKGGSPMAAIEADIRTAEAEIEQFVHKALGDVGSALT